MLGLALPSWRLSDKSIPSAAAANESEAGKEGLEVVTCVNCPTPDDPLELELYLWLSLPFRLRSVTRLLEMEMERENNSGEKEKGRDGKGRPDLCKSGCPYLRRSNY